MKGKITVPAKLKELFENIDLDPAAGEGDVLSAVHKESDNSLILQLSLSERVPFDTLFVAADAIRAELESGRVSIYPKYAPELFDEEAALDITRFLKREGYNVNGYFDDAKAAVSDGSVVYEL